MDPEPPDKIIGARALRKLGNKGTNEFVIKCGLVKSLVLDNNFRSAFEKEIQKRVVNTSKAAHSLSLVMNLFLKERIGKPKNIMDIGLDEDIFNTTFLYQLITGTESARKPSTLAKYVHEKFGHLVKPGIRSSGDTNSLVTVASEYSKNFKVYLQENFKGKQLAFLRAWTEAKYLNKDRIIVLLQSINGWPLKKDVVLSEAEHRMITFHRKVLNLKVNEIIDKKWIKNNYSKIIIYFSLLSRYLVKKGKKGILVAPICKIKTSFMYIDTRVLQGILKDSKIFIPKESMYSDTFNTSKLLTRNQKDSGFQFTGTIQTDSVAVIFHFRRPDTPDKIESDRKLEALKIIKKSETLIEKKIRIQKEKETTNLKRLEDQRLRNNQGVRVIGNDPGRSTLFCGVESINNGKFRNYSLSRKQFYTESGIFLATKRSNRWNVESLNLELDELSKTNSRANKLSDFKLYVNIVNKHYNKFWLEATKKRHSRQRFALYSGKQSVYSRFFQSFKIQSDSREIVIAYGDAGFASTSKYEIAAPTSALEKECSKWYQVVKIDEFRTTRLHYLTGTILSKVQEQITVIGTTEKISKKTIRGLLWYNSTKASKFIDRDLNAAKNILHCYNIYPLRPTGMARTDPKIEDPVIKIIKKTSKGVLVPESLGNYHEALMWLRIF